jgi:hypothetical protein
MPDVWCRNVGFCTGLLSDNLVSEYKTSKQVTVAWVWQPNTSLCSWKRLGNESLSRVKAVAVWISWLMVRAPALITVANLLLAAIQQI